MSMSGWVIGGRRFSTVHRRKSRVLASRRTAGARGTSKKSRSPRSIAADAAAQTQAILRVTATVDEGFWAGRKVVVTGHTGFKGAWLALWLQSLGAEVSGLSDAVPTEPSLHALLGGTDPDPVDVRDAEAVRSAIDAAAPQVVFHLA